MSLGLTRSAGTPSSGVPRLPLPRVCSLSPAPDTPARIAAQKVFSGSRGRGRDSSSGTARQNTPHRAAATPVAALGHGAALRQAGATDPHERDSFGQTPLIRAAMSGNTAAIQQLLGLGADAGAQDRWGTTALMLAAASGHAAAVRLLLQHGAEVDARDSRGRTALMAVSLWGEYTMMDNVGTLALPSIASAQGAYHCAEALVAAGADVDAEDDVGVTPLARLAHTLLDEHAAATARLLLAAGAAGAPALETALHYENLDALGVLISAGVDATALLARKLEFTQRHRLGAEEALLLLRAGASMGGLPLRLKQYAFELAMQAAAR